MNEKPRRFVFNYYGSPPARSEATYIFTNDPLIQLDEGETFPRNDKQSLAFQAKRLSLSDPVFGDSLAWSYREYIVHCLSAPGEADKTAACLGNAPVRYMERGTRQEQLERARRVLAAPADAQPTAGNRQQSRPLCLFNVLVALEWWPDQRYMQQLEWAFRRASDFLYDVTDGCMAFGQVVFGGPELMDCADIQIMASNRLFPRSWVSGMHEASKYIPIRLGRGWWRARDQVIIPWDEPEGYRTIIHEWAHYALDLHDAYLEPRRIGQADKETVIIPNTALASTSIMATLEGTSELVHHLSGDRSTHKRTEWDIILKRYPWLRPSPQTLEGPGRLPLPLPGFHRVGTLADRPPEPRADPVLRQFPDDIQRDRCWLYVLRGSLPDKLERVIAQGTLDARSASDGFPLLGAKTGDTVVLAGENQSDQTIIFSASVENNPKSHSVAPWREVPLDKPPVIDVVPYLMEDPSVSVLHGTAAQAQIRVRVRSTGGALPKQVWVFPLGHEQPEAAIRLGAPDRSDWMSEITPVPTLDGHVVVCWDEQLLISTFSQGGGPPTHTPVTTNPITAGSSDGNLMLFFDNRHAEQDYSHIKVITTLVHDIQARPPDGMQARSSIFSLASNAALPARLSPTLIMFYGTSLTQAGALPQLCRLADDNTWQPLPTYHPPGLSFVAIPLNTKTAESLVVDQLQAPRVEHYRLYSTAD